MAKKEQKKEEDALMPKTQVVRLKKLFSMSSAKENKVNLNKLN